MHDDYSRRSQREPSNAPEISGRVPTALRNEITKTVERCLRAFGRNLDGRVLVTSVTFDESTAHPAAVSSLAPGLEHSLEIRYTQTAQTHHLVPDERAFVQARLDAARAVLQQGATAAYHRDGFELAHEALQDMDSVLMEFARRNGLDAPQPE